MLVPAIIAYNVVSYSNRDVFIAAINRLISEGWQPLGGISACLNATSGNPYMPDKDFYQAMVKYEQPKLNSI